MDVDARRLARWERFVTRPDGNAACWAWVGYHTKRGYGVFRWSTALRTTAHRAGYRLLVGDFPDEYEVDHLCQNKGCVNPAHLEPVTKAENKRRAPVARGIAFPNARKTHCPKGHPYSGDNLRLYDGGTHRVCVACTKARTTAWWAARRKAA